MDPGERGCSVTHPAVVRGWDPGVHGGVGGRGGGEREIGKVLRRGKATPCGGG